MKFLYLLVLVAGVSCAGSEAVDVPDYIEVHSVYMSMACLDAQDQRQMDECGEKSMAEANKKLERIYSTLKSNYMKSEPDLFKALEVSQNSWDTYKVTSCKLETFYSREGSGFDAIWKGCLETKINERISYLNWMISNP